MNKFIGLVAAGVLTASSANATTYIALKGGSTIAPPCYSNPWITNVVATSIDNNGTVRGQIEYVGYANVGSGRGGTRTVYYTSIYSATWAIDGTLVATSLIVNNGCTAVNYLTGPFAVPNNQSYLHTYTNGYYTVNSQWTTAGNPPRSQWVTTLHY
jgi:hypothetical protein